jgi:hypothetical protein
MTVNTYPAYDGSADASRWRVGMHDLATDTGGARLIKTAAAEAYPLAAKPNPASADFFVSMWVKHTTLPAANYQYYMYTGGYATNVSGFSLCAYVAMPQAFVNDAVGGTRIQLSFSDITLVAGVWYHLLWVFNRTAGTLTLYVNGMASTTIGDISSKAAAYTPHASSVSCLGAANNAYYQMDGAMQDVMFGAGVPTATDRLELYNDGCGKRYNTLTAALQAKVTYAWNMDEATGTMASSATANNATFSAGNVLANDLFTTNMTSWTLIQGGTSTAARTTAEYHEGASSCELAIDGASTPAGISQTKAIAGREYTVTFYAKASAGTPTMSLSDAGGELQEFTLSTSWAQYTKTFTADDTTIKFVSKACTSASIYLDEVSARVTADSGTVHGPQAIPSNATSVKIAGTTALWRTESMRLALNPGTYTLKSLDVVLAQTLAADCVTAYFGILQGTTSAVTWMTFASTGLDYIDISDGLAPQAAAYTLRQKLGDVEITIADGVTYWFAVSLLSVDGHTTNQPEIGVMENGQGPTGGFWRHVGQATLSTAGLSYQAAGGGEEQIRMGLNFTTPVRHLYTYDGTYSAADTIIIPARTDGDWWIKAMAVVADGQALTCVLNDESAGSAAARNTLVLDMAATNQMTFGGQSNALAASEPGDTFELGINWRPATLKADLFYQNRTTGQGETGDAADLLTISHGVKKNAARGAASAYTVTGNPQWLALSGIATVTEIEVGWEPLVLFGDSQSLLFTSYTVTLPNSFTQPRMYFHAGIGGGYLTQSLGTVTAGYLRYKGTTTPYGSLCEMTGVVFVFCGYGLNDLGKATAATRNGIVMEWGWRAAEILHDLQDRSVAALIVGIPPYKVAVGSDIHDAHAIKDQFNPMLEGLAIGCRCAYLNPWWDCVVSGTENDDVPAANPTYINSTGHWEEAGITMICPKIVQSFESNVVGGPWTKRNTRGRRPGLLLPI